MNSPNPTSIQTATLANGCFWCTEAIFKKLKGVQSVTPGYSGGKRENPTYEQVSSGATGHAESIQILFDPTIISYHTILDIFFHTHDPTTLNRQGADTGTQYRSAIFYHNETQREIAEKLKEELDNSGKFEDPIVTEITPFTAFYEAEEYHRDFYERNRTAPYCRIVIDPKMQKLLKQYRLNINEDEIR